jgi:hypothetical protein
MNMQEHLWERAVPVTLRDVTLSAPPLFEAGDFYASAGALALERDGICDFARLAVRHLRGDWGDTLTGGVQENFAAIQNGWRVISEYVVNRQGDRVFVVTEADRSGTTFITAEEYHKGRRNGKAKH